MKLASTGSVVAISDPMNNNDNGDQVGIVKVFEYDFFIKQWKQLGDSISGDSFKGDGTNHRLGLSMGISSDGSVLAVAGWVAYPTRVYKYNNNNNKNNNNNNNKWLQISVT